MVKIFFIMVAFSITLIVFIYILKEGCWTKYIFTGSEYSIQSNILSQRRFWAILLSFKPGNVDVIFAYKPLLKTVST